MSENPSSRRPLWVPDEHSKSCMLCSQRFCLFLRRHHCRNCGTLVCHSCSSFNVPLPDIDYFKPVRVCTPCYHVQRFRSRSCEKQDNKIIQGQSIDDAAQISVPEPEARPIPIAQQEHPAQEVAPLGSEEEIVIGKHRTNSMNFADEYKTEREYQLERKEVTENFIESEVCDAIYHDSTSQEKPIINEKHSTEKNETDEDEVVGTFTREELQFGKGMVFDGNEDSDEFYSSDDSSSDDPPASRLLQLRPVFEYKQPEGVKSILRRNSCQTTGSRKTVRFATDNEIRYFTPAEEDPFELSLSSLQEELYDEDSSSMDESSDDIDQYFHEQYTQGYNNDDDFMEPSVYLQQIISVLHAAPQNEDSSSIDLASTDSDDDIVIGGDSDYEEGDDTTDLEELKLDMNTTGERRTREDEPEDTTLSTETSVVDHVRIDSFQSQDELHSTYLSESSSQLLGVTDS